MSRHSLFSSPRLVRQVRGLGFGTALVVLAAGAIAQGTTSGTTAPGTPGATGAAAALDRSDRSFLEDAAQGGMAEVALGKLASSKPPMRRSRASATAWRKTTARPTTS